MAFGAGTRMVEGRPAETREIVQVELGMVDVDIAGRYFGNPAKPAARPIPTV